MKSCVINDGDAKLTGLDEQAASDAEQCDHASFMATNIKYDLRARPILPVCQLSPRSMLGRVDELEGTLRSGEQERQQRLREGLRASPARAEARPEAYVAAPPAAVAPPAARQVLMHGPASGACLC